MCHRRGSGAPMPPLRRRRPRYQTIEIAMRFARIAMEAECFEDVVVAMESVAMLSSDVLTTRQMHMLGLGYRKVMEAKRRQRRQLEIHRLREARRRRRIRGGISTAAMWIRDFIHKIERDMDNICRDAKFIIDEHILYYSFVEIVFYHKLLGDLYKNSCLYKSGNGLVERASASLHEYEIAFDLDIPGNTPLRLSLAADSSTLCHKILDLTQRARDIIKTALGAVIEDTLEECSMLLVQSLKDKLQIQILGPDEENGEDVDGGHEENGEDVDGGHEAEGENNIGGNED